MKLVFLHAFPFDERMWDTLEGTAVRLYGRGPDMDEWARQIAAELGIWLYGGGRRREGARLLEQAAAAAARSGDHDLAMRLAAQRIVWVQGRYLPQDIALSDRARGIELAR